MSTLMKAAQEGDTRSVKAMIASDARLDDHFLYTPLIWAASGGHTAIVKLRLAAGARRVARPNRAHLAAKHGHAKIAAMLIAGGANRSFEWPIVC
ncbi:MAG: ankyrin repeat domain-containing protein [Thermoguttaceae bacterium]